MTATRLSTAVASLSTGAVLLSTLFAFPAAAATDPAIDSRPVASPSTASAPPAGASGRFVVKFKTGTAGTVNARANAYGQAARTSGVSVTELHATARGAAVVQADGALTPRGSAKVLASLRGQSSVEYAEPDTFIRPASTPNDPLYPQQWDLSEDTAGMRVPAAWDTASGLGAVVAVIDTGITPHSDLTNILPGYDFISDTTKSNDGDGRDGDATDAGDYCNGSPSSWHGTHVAGTIGAAANNGIGIAGVAYSAKILPVRALGTCGGYLSDIADAVVWAVGGTVTGVPANANPARVINMSLGGSGQCGSYFQSALDYAAAQGVTVVAAAGNENSPASGSTPANCNNIITVGATGREGNKASYSNYGPEVDVSAPGGDGSTGRANTILSTWNNGTTAQGSETYGYMQGTSMAAPHVAGVAALMLSANPALTPAQVETILMETARPLPGTCSTGGCGNGLVDAAAAVGSVLPSAVPYVTAGVPRIDGEAVVGHALTVSAGTWSPEGASLTYHWRRDGVEIPGATAATYPAAAADAGALLSVTVTGSADGYHPSAATTSPVVVVPQPSLSGTARVSSTLVAGPQDWPADVARQYQWFRSGVAVSGASGTHYTLGAGDLGQTMKVRVTASWPDQRSAALDSPSSVAVARGTLTGPTPTIGGTRKVGYTLTAVPGTWTSGTFLKYQWYRSGRPISGATGPKYTLGAADQGKIMRLRVGGIKAGYTTIVRDSGTTSAIAAGSLASSRPWISGSARYGYRLTANTGTWTAGTALRYQWYRSGAAISGATGRYYRITWADRYDVMSVRVVGSKAGYTSLARYSRYSARVP
jgi:serine protease